MRASARSLTRHFLLQQRKPNPLAKVGVSLRVICQTHFVGGKKILSLHGMCRQSSRMKIPHSQSQCQLGEPLFIVHLILQAHCTVRPQTLLLIQSFQTHQSNLLAVRQPLGLLLPKKLCCC